MAQENYYKNSQFGNVAGALLAKKGKPDKKKIFKTILGSILETSVSQAAIDLKQGVINGANDVRDKFGDIMESTVASYEDFDVNRKRYKEWERNGDKFLNKEAISDINYTTANAGKNFTWETRFSDTVTQKDRDAMDESLKAEIELKRKEMEIIGQDKRATMNKVEFTQPVKDAFKAALAEVEDDPTKKNLVTSYFNRIFKTEKDADGNLVSRNAEKIKLQVAAERVEGIVLQQEKDIAKATLDLTNYYGNIRANSIGELKSSTIIKSMPPVTAKEKQQQRVLNNKFIYTGSGSEQKENENYFNISLEIPVRIPAVEDDPTTKEKENIKILNIKENNFKNILILNEDGIVQSYSRDLFFQAVEERQIMTTKMMEKAKKTPITGSASFDNVIAQFAKEGRFGTAAVLDITELKGWDKILGVEDGTVIKADSIIFNLPGNSILTSEDGKTGVSDAIHAHLNNGKENGDENPNEFNFIELQTTFASKRFLEADKMVQLRELKSIITMFPDKEETINETYKKFIDTYNVSKKQEKVKEINKNIITVDNLENVNIVVGKAADGSDINWSDRPIINKIIEVESTGRVGEISKHGAKGLMQIKDATADSPGMGVPPAVRDKAGNISAEENVIFGTNYFDALTEKYNGDLVTAALAYNAGMGTIDKWIKEGRNYNSLRTETQNYVGKIFGKDIQELVKAGTYGQDIIQTPTETPVTSSLLSSDKTYRTYSEVMGDDSLSDIQKEDELSRRSRDEFKKSIKSIPSKLNERGLNQAKKRANDFLSGEISYFYSPTYNKWKTKNNIKENTSTPKEEKQKNVKEFLDFLNQ
tara:strand:+ start:506 stop:2962 length:2457 start_codon:yes stop_codon:yes gene_type:complete